MNRTCILSSILALTLSVSSVHTYGQVVTQWTGLNSDQFTHPANWTNGVPLASDTAHLDLPGDYLVFLDNDVEVDVLRVFNTSDATFYGQHGLATNFVEVFQNASLKIDDESSISTNNGFVVGDLQSGNLRVSGGGEFKSNSFSTNVIGKGPSIGGTILVVGSGSSYSSGNLVVGEEGSGIFSIQSGADALVLGDTTVARFSTSNANANVIVGSIWESRGDFTIASELNSNGSVFVANSGSTLETGDSSTNVLYVGKNGEGSLTVRDDASVISQSVTVGSEFAGTGDVCVDIGANWQINGNSLVVGDAQGSSGSIEILGNGSLLDINAPLTTIGREGFGSLVVSNLANVDARSVQIGNLAGGVGEVTVTKGALLRVTNGLIAVGQNNASGDLTVEDRGRVESNGTLQIGGTATAGAEVHVVGTDSILACSNILNSGVVNIDDGGVVDVVASVDVPFDTSPNTGTIFVGPNSALNIGNAIAIGTTSGEAGTVTVDGGSLTAAFNSLIRSNGTLNIADGMFNSLVLTNQGVIFIPSGTADIFANVRNNASGLVTSSLAANSVNFMGSLENDGEVRTSSGAVTNCFAIWSGIGPFTGQGEVRFMGVMEPGNEVFNIFFEGDVVLESSADARMEIGGTQNLKFDQLFIQGDLDIQGAQLQISLIDGFQLSEGDSFVLFNVVGTQTGEFQGLPEGSVVGTFGALNLEISYSGGSGNDIVVTATQATVMLGDVNLDGDVNLLDVAPFIDRITSAVYQLEADCNEDGLVNLLDVNPFVNILTGM